MITLLIQVKNTQKSLNKQSNLNVVLVTGF